jgi:hypothetical protein
MYTNETNGETNVTTGLDSFPGGMYWKKDVRLHSGERAYLTAQNDSDHGSVLVEILSDGKVVKSSESSGAYCIATVSLQL